MPGFLVFPMILFDAVIVNMLTITLASNVHKESVKLLRVMAKNAIGQGQYAVTKRQLRACTLLKIKFGSNFIDRGTPLVIQTFCLNQTVSLGLIRSNK